MAHLKIVPVILLNIIYTATVNSLDICGGEKIPKCQFKNATDCLKNQVVPDFLKWLGPGQPAYFLEPVDPMLLDELQLATSKGVYTLKNVKITGLSQVKCKELVFEISDGLLEYTLEANFKVTADQFVDEDNYSLLKDPPLVVRLDKIQSHSSIKIEVVQRCKEQNLAYKNVDIEVPDADYCKRVAIEHGVCKLDDELKQVLANTVAEVTATKLSDSFEAMNKIVSLSAYFINK